jgi:signal transduction histidine kinase
LRWTIFDILKLKGVELNDDEVLVINASIDGSIRKSVNAFALAQAALRERFIATLTHDLRNPLSNANIAAQLIRRSSDLAKIRDFAGLITDNLSRMDGMIRDLLESVTFQSGDRLRLRLEEFDMNDVAKEVWGEFTATHGPRFQFIGNTARGWWDREAIKRAIENIIGNAVKYSAPETPIRIKIDLQHGRTILTVHNEGEPIPPEQTEYIFQVFRRAIAAKAWNKEGWGIGLPYVRSVAESHGGSVAVDSTVDRGTTFTIDVPIDARPYQDAPTLSTKSD